MNDLQRMLFADQLLRTSSLNRKDYSPQSTCLSDSKSRALITITVLGQASGGLQNIVLLNYRRQKRSELHE